MKDKKQKIALINQKRFIREVTKAFPLDVAIEMYNAFYKAGFLDEYGYLK